MSRQIFRGLAGKINSFRYLNREKSDSSKDNVSNEDTAFETEYFYRQNKQLLALLRQKTQEEIKSMQDEVRSMRIKIEEYDRDINENLRFLKGLDKDLSASDKK